ncbi:bifunctional protein GlmU [alpha proteobacterium Q-1]|nr:bifunctional protein GlmU [alpha proteobacterium Q-1]
MADYPPNLWPIPCAILAAGLSRRMGGPNKLLADLHGHPVLAHSVAAALEADIGPVWVIVGHEAESVRAALAAYPVQIVDNPDHGQGLSTSIRAAMALVPAHSPGLMIHLGDMPLVRAATIRAVYNGFCRAKAGLQTAGIIAARPMAAGGAGNPVLCGAAMFDDLRRLEGDHGAGALLRSKPDALLQVAVNDPAIHWDVDDPEALRRAWMTMDQMKREKKAPG